MKLKQKYAILILVIVIFISLYVRQEVACNPPYIKVGSSCCLDQNNNSICDKDEKSITGKIVEKNTISKVIDGDTVKLQTGETVRLLGINAPEKGQVYYKESASRLRELIEGKKVFLEKDVEDKDKYGRLLRYIFLNGENINVKLVREGLATVYIISPNVKYETELREAENKAKNSKINIWKTPEQEGEKICDNRCIGISYFHYDAEGEDCKNLNDEYVIFKNSCPYSCNLTGWCVKDGSSREPFVFPTFILESGAIVTLYTGCGVNTDRSLYWCSSGHSCNAIWNNKGDTLYLRNSKGELILSYSYSG
ncbi:MAG: hypothetical protein DRP10_04455 [Candidatus Aenigmatarchaeota archaeon]|nr:MAG: hypothetical protein DRP10_04455 [Candidatus Aenigmarchaeota archaeon]